MKNNNTGQPTIIYFGNDWSADNKTSSHHIAMRLLRDHRLIYIECPGLRAPQTSKRDIGKIFKKMFKVLSGAKRIKGDSYVYTLFQIPFHRFSLIQKLNKKLIIWQCRNICRKYNINKPILWFVVPHVAMVLGKLNEGMSVYYCVDDYVELPGVNKTMIREMDGRMTSECNLVFVTSEPLFKQKKKYARKIILSKHGVDFEHFNSVYKKENMIPQEISTIGKPVIGFFGLIETWVDLDLIHYLATERPDWKFLMIGRSAIDISSCNELDNVYFIGSKTYDELPSYAQVFDVALIPCKANELIRNFNPLKLREYLAMGVPVVSVYFPEIEEFRGLVRIADKYDDFLAEIKSLLEMDYSDEAVRGIKLVEPLSWENRYKNVKEAVYKELEEIS